MARKRKARKSARHQIPRTFYCKRLQYIIEPPDLTDISAIEEKCSVCIELLKSSLIYFEDVFSDLGDISRISQDLVAGIYGEISEIEGILERYSNDKDVISLQRDLEDESSSLDNMLSDLNFNLPSELFGYSGEQERIEKLLESIEGKIGNEIKLVKAVGYGLYHVMIGAA